jgi:hypothetical protein
LTASNRGMHACACFNLSLSKHPEKSMESTARSGTCWLLPASRPETWCRRTLSLCLKR